MSHHHATVLWNRTEENFSSNTYSRVHEWRFDGGMVITASSSPDVVPVPYSDPNYIDPEEAFVAALSSCHMLFFLSIAAKRHMVVDSYQDEAVGEMAKDGNGRQALVRVTLSPAVRFSGDPVPTEEAVQRLHQQAHQMCYLTNSVKCEIEIKMRRDITPLPPAGDAIS